MVFQVQEKTFGWLEEYKLLHLFNQGVIDEIVISVIPVLLGKGIPLFHNLEDETKLELIKTEKLVN